MKLLSEAAGANIAIVSLAEGRDEEQGDCHGGTGVLIRHPNFNAKKVVNTKLPTGI